MNGKNNSDQDGGKADHSGTLQFRIIRPQGAYGIRARARPFFRRRLSAQDRSSADYHDHLHQSLLQIQKDESAQSGIIHRHQNAPELQKIVRKALCKILSQSRRRTRGHVAPSARRTPQKNCQLEKG